MDLNELLKVLVFFLGYLTIRNSHGKSENELSGLVVSVFTFVDVADLSFCAKRVAALGKISLPLGVWIWSGSSHHVLFCCRPVVFCFLL